MITTITMTIISLITLIITLRTLWPPPDFAEALLRLGADHDAGRLPSNSHSNSHSNSNSNSNSISGAGKAR